MVVDWPGPEEAGRAGDLVGSDQELVPADSSSESSAVLNCFTVVFGFSWAMPIMWYFDAGVVEVDLHEAGLRGCP